MDKFEPTPTLYPSGFPLWSLRATQSPFGSLINGSFRYSEIVAYPLSLAESTPTLFAWLIKVGSESFLSSSLRRSSMLWVGSFILNARHRRGPGHQDSLSSFLWHTFFFYLRYFFHNSLAAFASSVSLV